MSRLVCRHSYDIAQGTKGSRIAIRIALAPSVRSGMTDGLPTSSHRGEGKPRKCASLCMQDEEEGCVLSGVGRTWWYLGRHKGGNAQMMHT